MGDSISVEAVKNIIKVAKASRKKLQRVNVEISLKGIAVNDLQGNEMFKISIYRISNCSTDASHRQVFSFISTDANETMECHAFLCSKRKLAETVTLAVAHAFSTAYEAWRILPSTKEFQQTSVESENQKNVEANSSPVKISLAPFQEKSQKLTSIKTEEEKLIDFDDDFSAKPLTISLVPFTERSNGILKSPKAETKDSNAWVSFDDDFTSTLKWPMSKVDLILA